MIAFADRAALDRYTRAVLLATIDLHIAAAEKALDTALVGVPADAGKVLRQFVKMDQALLRAEANRLPLPVVPIP